MRRRPGATTQRGDDAHDTGVLDLTDVGGAEHIDKLAQKYLGGPYPWFGGRDQVRVIMTIGAEKISSQG
ncbi:MAG: hypothetical protein QOH97_2599 [Actinoplanes sp.]|nr:hypothetical protein [Actinoplanes sp.]